VTYTVAGHWLYKVMIFFGNSGNKSNHINVDYIYFISPAI
jgi:hypothetical protein